MPMQRRLPPQVVQCVSSGSFVTVRQQSLCRTHAQAQRCPWVIHQRQQPLQRVACLRQAMHQAGPVAAACGPSSARTCAPCVLSCASTSSGFACHLLITFNGGLFSARALRWGVRWPGVADFERPPPLQLFFCTFSVVRRYCRFTCSRAQTLNRPHPSRAHDTTCALALSQPEQAGLHIGRVYVLTVPPHSRGSPSRPSRKPCLPSAGLVVPVSAARSRRSRSCRAVTRTRCPCPSSSKPNGRTFTRTPAASSVCCVCCI